MQIVSIETIFLKCQILFLGKTIQNITNILSAEFVQRVVKVNKKEKNSIGFISCIKFGLIKMY